MTPHCVRAWLAAACLLASGTIRADVFINEFLASNKADLADEDGDYPDWIELFNSGLETVDLGGYYLTDDSAVPQKWVLPQYLLPPGEFLIIMASSKNRDGGQFHTNFSLDSAGEYLALVNPQGAVLQEFAPAYPAQNSDVSYGLSDPTPGSPLVYFPNPTPGAVNSSYGQLGVAPTFSVTSRTFSTPFSATLSTQIVGGQIRYTVDGSLPEATSTLYSEALTISQTTVLRARVFLATSPASVPGGETYLLLAPDVLATTSNLPLMIIDDFSAGRPTNGALAEWMIFEPTAPSGRSSLTSTPSLTSRSLIKVRGSSTASAAKYSLAVETRNQLDQDRRLEPLDFPSDADWVLNAPYEYDRSLLHNPLIFQLSNELGRYASRTRQVELYLNTDGGPVSQADYFGVYTLMEKITRSEDRVDIQKLQSSHNALPEISGGYLMKIDRGDPATPGQPADVGISAAGQQLYWVDPKEQETTSAQRTWITNYLNAFSTALSAPTWRDPVVGYAGYLDLSAAIDHHLLNVAAKNVDALRLSTYWSKDRGGKVVFGPLWDFDRALDSMDGRDNNFNTWRGESGDLGTDFFRYTWWNELFRDSNFWQQWIDRYAELRQGPLAASHIHAVVDSMAAEVLEAQERNFLRWPAAPPRVSWAWEVQHLKDWIAARLDWMDQQFTRPAESNAPTPQGGAVPGGFPLTLTSPSLARPGAKIYYTVNNSDPRLPAADFIEQRVLVPLTMPAKGYLPASDIGTSWRGSAQSPDPFDDSAWISGTNGLGYDDVADYDPYIGINLEFPAPIMKSVMGSAYVRMRFTMTAEDLALVQRMILRVRYDDGFVAFLNGVQIASANAPTVLAWNSAAAASHSDVESIKLLPFDVSAFASVLHLGENVLALHGLNTPLNSTDFLVQAELVGGLEPPEISPSAVEYASPIVINEPVNLMVRVYDPAGPFTPYPYTGVGSGSTPVGSHWSAPLRLYMLANAGPPSLGGLLISEIMHTPAGPTPAESGAGFSREDFEYIVLKNTGPSTLSLAGIQLTGGISFIAGLGEHTALAAGGIVVVAANPSALVWRYGPNLPVLGGYAGHLNDSADMLSLLDAQGNILHSLAYGAAEPWPAGASTTGRSLVLRSATAASLPANAPGHWRASLDPLGEIPGTLPTTFTDWKVRHFDPSSPTFSVDSALEADPDRDGLTNLVEYASGLPPTEPGPLPLRFVQQGSQIMAEFDRRPGLADFSVNLLCTPDLGGSWCAPPMGTPQANDHGTETLQTPVGGVSSQREFYRLEVLQP